jgi:P4 family phage/plasmid primase-like protien
MKELVQAAIDAGWHVYRAAGKRPLDKDWLKVSTGAVVAHVVEGGNWGLVPQGQQVVVDFDDMDAYESLAALIPETITVRTGKGVHVYLMMPEERDPRELPVSFNGGDIRRANQGGVIGPGSIHPVTKGRYTAERWFDTGKPAELPQGLIDALVAATKSKVVAKAKAKAGELIQDGERYQFMLRRTYKMAMIPWLTRGEIMAAISEGTVDMLEDGREFYDAARCAGLVDSALAKRQLLALEDYSEYGIAMQYIAGSNGRSVFYQKEWYRWVEGSWQRDAGIYDRVMDVVKMVTASDEKEAIAFRKQAGSARFLDGVLKIIGRQLEVKPPFFDAQKNIVPFANGVWDMEGGTFRAESPEDKVLTRLSVAYDPKAECPKWMEALSWAANGDPEVIDYMQRVFGLLLSGDTGRFAFFAIGPKASGKTTMFTAFAKMLGHLSGTFQPRLLLGNQGFDAEEQDLRASSKLVGKRFVYADETEDGATIKAATFKRLAAPGVILQARRLREDAFEFENQAKLVVLTNEEPKLDANDEAAWSRVKYLPFTQSVPQDRQREGFGEELAAEAAGVLRWALDGYKGYRERGLAEPESVLGRTRQWKAETSTLGDFFYRFLVEDAGGRVKLKELFNIYNGWVTEESLGKSALFESTRELSKQIRRFLGSADCVRKFGVKNESYLFGWRMTN